MNGLVLSFCLLATGGAGPVEAHFVQVAPTPQASSMPLRSPSRTHAVVLIQGLRIHPIWSSDAAVAEFASWQQPGSHLVQALAADADVFAFAYAQTIPVDQVAALPALSGGLRKLRELGYQEITLVGFSAGGVVARQLVEDEPECGVTKVVQVCAPNGGSSWARLNASVPANQKVFLDSLTKQARARALRERVEKKIPPGVQFVCVIGDGLPMGDGLVSTGSQWPEDLQRQGIPATLLHTEHLGAVRSAAGTKRIAELVRESHPRWSPAQVAALRQRLRGKGTLLSDLWQRTP